MKSKRFLCILVTFAACGPASAADIRMTNANQVPKLSQNQNFADLMNPRPTDLMLNNNALTYQQLPTAGGNNINDPHAQVDTSRVRAADGFPSQIFVAGNTNLLGYRPFRNGDLTDINGGAFHCSPTSAAMIMQFWAARMNMAALGQVNPETVVQYIDSVANAMDTNDQNPNLNNTDATAHFGTVVGDIANGMNAFAQGRVNGIRLRAAAAAAFNADDYRRAINANRPVLVSFRERGALLGHSVVGIGYSTMTDAASRLTGLFVRDPSTNNNEDAMGLPNAAQFIPFARADGFRPNSEGDMYVSTSNGSLLEDAVMYDFEVVPEPASAALLLTALCGLGLQKVRRRRIL
jgi:Peptidase_C39 like family